MKNKGFQKAPREITSAERAIIGGAAVLGNSGESEQTVKNPQTDVEAPPVVLKPKSATTPTPRKKTAPAPVVEPPWASENPEIPAHHNWKMSRVTKAKIVWIRDNVPNMGSIQKIMDHLLLSGVEELLKKHYKD